MPEPEASRAVRVLRSAHARGDLTDHELAVALDRLAPGRQTRTDGGRREAILHAATRVFASKGYHGATLQDVAAEVGLSRPTFYHYFKSKQEILEAICLGAAEAVDAVVAAAVAEASAETATTAANATTTAANAPAAPREAVRRTLLAYARHIAAQESTATMMRNFDEMSLPAQKAIVDRRRRREGQLLRLVEVGIAAGDLEAAEPKIAVLAAFEAINTMHNWYEPGGRLSIDEVASVLVDQILRGMLARPPSGANLTLY